MEFQQLLLPITSANWTCVTVSASLTVFSIRILLFTYYSFIIHIFNYHSHSIQIFFMLPCDGNLSGPLPHACLALIEL